MIVTDFLIVFSRDKAEKGNIGVITKRRIELGAMENAVEAEANALDKGIFCLCGGFWYCGKMLLSLNRLTFQRRYDIIKMLNYVLLHSEREGTERTFLRRKDD